MKKILTILIITIILLLASCSQEASDDFVLVEGGRFVNTNSNYYGTDVIISDFYINKYEVTAEEWLRIMDHNPSQFYGENLPVEMVSWYDCIEYCNRRSIKEGLEPYYNIDKDAIDPDNNSQYDDIKWTVTINEEANGYRLPTQAEWEYAASGGQKSENYTYSGSNDADEIGWHWKNAGDEYLSGDWSWGAISNNNNRTKAVGSMKPNELGLYDMSGNVREWCWDWYDEADSDSGTYRVLKGGGWLGDVSCCEISFKGKYEANGIGPDSGLRLCRNY